MNGDNDSSNSMMESVVQQQQLQSQLCASCDRCRARKTKCDGERPCGNCAAKYMKRNKLNGIEGVPFEAFECIYSPAKRRGPHPGRSTTGPHPSSAAASPRSTTGPAEAVQSSSNLDPDTNWLAGLQQQQQLQQQQEMMGLQQQQQQQQPIDLTTASFLQHNNSANHLLAAAAQQRRDANHALAAVAGITLSNIDAQQQQLLQLHNQINIESNSNHHNNEALLQAKRVRKEEQHDASQIPRTIVKHTHLLDRNDPVGCRLRAYYKLTIDELLRLPQTPSDEEYCAMLGHGSNLSLIPGVHLAALSAARFAETALGAIVASNDVALAMELCNAVVHCLRESVKEPVETTAMYEVAKAYFLLGVFRAFRGDMERYFKYRRVSLTYLGKLENDNRTNTLLAAISWLDSWAYMIYNANETDIPDIDTAVPQVQSSTAGHLRSCSARNRAIEEKYNVKTDPFSVATNPQNKNWIQGAPPVFLNNEAPLHARALDALSCAVRTCCDQANSRFEELDKASTSDGNPTAVGMSCSRPSATCSAVMNNENELCSRNMVLSAYTLMQQSEATNQGSNHDACKFVGLHLVVSAMDAFLENDETSDGGFTDSQVQSLLSVCNTVIENPFLLHHAGPTYHMVTNAAVLLCHLLNGMHALKNTNHSGPMEATMFEEVFDTYISIRKLLTIHRRKLPVKLRCHGLPRPIMNPQDGQALIDLGETLLCACHGCQGFVLMACSPCVAAERARAAVSHLEVAEAQEAEATELGDIYDAGADLGAEFDLDDDALLSMISGLISS